MEGQGAASLSAGAIDGKPDAPLVTAIVRASGDNTPEHLASLLRQGATGRDGR